MDTIKRAFIIGDEWLYYKIYTGHKTADAVLTDVIKPLGEKLVKEGFADRWFFIRYGDPKSHIRVRFHNKDEKKLSEVMFAFKEAVRPYIDHNLIWKVQADIYQREVERYGANTMELSEEIFYCDSKMIAEMLDMIEGEEGEKIRWLFSLRAMDALLDDFKFGIDKKFELLSKLRYGFGEEFNMNKQLSKQIHGKFREHKQEIATVLDRSKDQNSEMQPLFQLLQQKSAAIKTAAAKILEIETEGKLQIALNDLMSSYLHMLCNRIFRSRQRMHELVVYNFLSAYYRQEVMREKHAGNQ